jgi:hypothetical protein
MSQLRLTRIRDARKLKDRRSTAPQAGPMKRNGVPKMSLMSDDTRQSDNEHEAMSPYFFIVVLGAVILLLIFG